MTTDQKLRERLDDVHVPDAAAAEERSWRVVQAAHASRGRAPSRRRVRLALAPAALVLVGLLVATSGTAIGDWLEDLTHPGRKDANPALSSLPAHGGLLVTSPRGPWIVQRSGSKRLLGSYGDAAWSPRGLFVAVTEGHQLVAVEPGGRVRWTVARPTPPSRPSWSPSGFRIAYVTAGTLRLVAGDGTGDRLLAPSAAEARPAWRPGPGHVLAYADARGRVHVTDADARRELWRSRPGAVPRTVAWSADGRRIVVLAPTAMRIYDGRGTLLRTLRAPLYDARFAPRGHRLALARATGAGRRSDVSLLDAERGDAPPAPLFVGSGELTDLAWSPDGRWLLVGWPSADQWVFVRADGRRRGVVAIANVRRQFSPGHPTTGAFPHVEGWCCARRGAPG